MCTRRTSRPLRAPDVVVSLVLLFVVEVVAVESLVPLFVVEVVWVVCGGVTCSAHVHVFRVLSCCYAATV